MESGLAVPAHASDLLEDRGVAVIVIEPYTSCPGRCQPLADRLGIFDRGRVVTPDTAGAVQLSAGTAR
jgi:hypothetical protein